MKKLNDEEKSFLFQFYEFKKKYSNIYARLRFITILLFLIPIMIWILYFFGDKGYVLIYTSLKVGDALGFYGSLLAFIGTLFLGILALWQNKKANEINMHLLDITKESIELEKQKYMSFILVEDVKLNVVDDIIRLTIKYKNSGEVPIYRIRLIQNPQDICLQDRDGEYHRYIYTSNIPMDKEENKIINIGESSEITTDIPKDTKYSKKGIVYLKTEIESIYNSRRFELLLIEFQITDENTASLIDRHEYFYKDEKELNDKYENIFNT